MEYLTKENITLIIAIIGAIGSISSWIYTYWTNKKNIDIKCVKMYRTGPIIIGYFMFENKSRMSISINSVSLIYNNEKIQCSLIPQKAFESTSNTGNTITDKKQYYNMKFPISLNSLSGDSGYLTFNMKKYGIISLDDKVNELTFSIGTNRGKEQKVVVKANWEKDFSKLF